MEQALMGRRSPLRPLSAVEPAPKKRLSVRDDYALSPHDAPADAALTGSALGRALAVLETLVQTDRSLGLAEIANRLGVPRQTAHRIISQLLGLGLLQRHIDRDRFLPGPRMRWLALETLCQSTSTAPWHAILEDLAESTGETCNVGVLDKGKVLLIDRVESKWALRVHSEVGRRLEPHSSAIGRLLLAHLDKQRRHQLIAPERSNASRPTRSSMRTNWKRTSPSSGGKATHSPIRRRRSASLPSRCRSPIRRAAWWRASPARFRWCACPPRRPWRRCCRFCAAPRNAWSGCWPPTSDRLG